MNLVLKVVSYSLLPCLYSLCSDKHLKSDCLLLHKLLHTKNVVLNICLFVFEAFHSHAEKQTE